jgi:serine/alanine adding enzyme
LLKLRSGEAMAEGTRELILAAEAPANTTANSRLKVVVWNDRNSWDRFVEAHPEASNYHRWVWKEVIEETYGHRSFYLAAVRGAAIEGVLPLFWIRSRLFGQFLTSVPFFSYGGVLANSQEAAQALLAHAVDLARELGARHIELRQGSECDVPWHHMNSKITMLVNLPDKVDDLWRGLSTGIRNKIRSARKQGLTYEVGDSVHVEVFYSIFSQNMRNLGTPVYPKSWFANLFRCAPEGLKVLRVHDHGKPVGAGIISTYRNVAEWPWSATLPESRRKYSAVFLHWALLEWATETGLKVVDLGRCTPGSGTYEFKRHWRCQERPLHWYVWLAPGSSPPAMHADNPRYRWATRAWRRLPLPVANRLGPMIARSIP